MLATAFASGAQASAIATSGPGRLLSVLVSTVGTGTVTIYDNATAASGSILVVIPASLASGTLVQLAAPGIGVPYINGLWCVTTASSPVITVLTSPNCPNDGRPAT